MHGWIVGLMACCCLAGPVGSAAAQPAPVLNLPREAPRNALVGGAGPEWGTDAGGIGEYSGFAYERTIFPRVFVRGELGQAYNGAGSGRARDLVAGGIPVRETIYTDVLRFSLAGQVGYSQPLSSTSRVIALAGPAWLRVSEQEDRFLTDLRFGDTLQRRRQTFSDNRFGASIGVGFEIDMADNIAWRVMVQHQRASEAHQTGISLGAALRF